MVIFYDADRLERMSTYPGVDPHESRVIRQFIRRHGHEFTEWRFGVRIGEGARLPESNDPALRVAWEAITRARPDVIAMRSPTRAAIIEAKDGWYNEAVWQVLGYRDLYQQTYPDHDVELIGLARVSTATARELARTQGVRLYLYALEPAAVDVGETAAELEPETPA